MPRFPRTSSAAGGLSASVYQTLTALAQANAPEVFPLNVGDTHRAAPRAAWPEQLPAAREPSQFRYAPVQGLPALLDAFTVELSRHGAPPGRENMQVVPGATHGLTLACTALLSPGEELLLPAPYWPLIRGIASSVGARAVEVPIGHPRTRTADEMYFALEAAITPNSAAIYLNNPHNPTGDLWSHDQLDAVAQLATRHELWVLCDQAYEALVYAHDHAPASFRHPDLAPRAIAAHTLSKSHGLSGARIGLLHGPAEAMQAVRALATFQMYCAARPMQAAAARALSDPGGAAWLEEARTEYGLAAKSAAQVLGVATPDSGSFLFFDTRPCRRAEETGTQFLQRCARAGVVLTEGRACGSMYDEWARLCFTAVPPGALDRALCTLERVLMDR